MNMSHMLFTKVIESQMFRSRSEKRFASSVLSVCVWIVVVVFVVESGVFFYSLLALPCPLQADDIVEAIELSSCN